MGYPKVIFGSCFALLILSCVHAEEPDPPPASAPAELQVYAPGLVVEPSFRIRGKGFQWDHEIQVALPATYNTEHRAYPVLWVTDGSVNFSLAVQVLGIAKYLHLPEMIVVGIGVPHEEFGELQARRTYELTLNNKVGFEGIGGDVLKRTIKSQGEAQLPSSATGGAPKFLDFLVDELRPTLEKKYRMSGSHTLFGSSGGGFLCTYALLARPQSFDKYLCLSPDLNANDYALFGLEKQYAQAHQDLPAAVYFAAGENEILQGGIISALGIVSSMSRMAEILKLRGYPSLRLYVHIFPDEQHGTFKVSGIEHGLQALWGNNGPAEPRAAQ